MIGRAYPDLSELAYHIISLSDFWKRSANRSDKDSGVHVIAKMIAISFGVEKADRIARAVMRELDSIRAERTEDEIDPEGIEVVFISALLHEHVDELPVPAATSYWTSVFG
jgi:hypothetical protein